MGEGTDVDFLLALTKLRVNRRQGRFSPHKPALMLAVLDLALADKLAQNRIVPEPALLTRYRAFWEAVAEPGDQPNPFLPFFHLRSESFWHLHAASGRDEMLKAMRTVNSLSELRANVEYAELDETTWRQLQDPRFVEDAAQVLITHWFDDKQQAVQAVWDESKQVSQYELILDRETEAILQQDEQAAYVPARDAAFRRLVLEAYDYRCAASGWRFMLDDWFLVEAAHIVPFSESYNDHPRNGIALSPTYHRLMDQGVIAPGPDYRWHVSKLVDRRIPDNKALIELDGAPLILPRNKARAPDEACLAQRLERLL
jgi:putative restriction endonuclease